MISSQTTGVNNTSSFTKATQSSSTSGTDSASQFETFLKMLTTQIKNQDPLNPMEGTEFAVQLATFSGVEQQVQTNQLLSSLVEKTGSDSLTQLSSWIDKEVCTTAPVWFDGSSLSLQLDDWDSGASASLVILDAQGREVGKTNISSHAAGDYIWSGEIQGGKAPAGQYTFRIDVEKDGSTIESNAVGAYTSVTGVKLDKDGTVLSLTGGRSATLDEITGVRSRQSDSTS